ncbi:hypothetical protein NDU88_003881 [Pleurodeles waltl]|uniref:Uncharacterized protein n=1 Tax=Pleurodeles waltl TaxID=8319 RepID=A0AAV7KW70_PLEWA|nr:hypothetical protein NDU88_003881 [Pleurodeles waltl]
MSLQHPARCYQIPLRMASGLNLPGNAWAPPTGVTAQQHTSSHRQSTHQCPTRVGRLNPPASPAAFRAGPLAAQMQPLTCPSAPPGRPGPGATRSPALQSPESLKAQVGHRVHADREGNDGRGATGAAARSSCRASPPEPCPPPAPRGHRYQLSMDSPPSEARAEAQSQSHPRESGPRTGLNRGTAASNLSLGLAQGSAQVHSSREGQQDKYLKIIGPRPGRASLSDGHLAWQPGHAPNGRSPYLFR